MAAAATPAGLIETSGGSRALLDWLGGIVDPIGEDRPFGEDVERLVSAPWPPG